MPSMIEFPLDLPEVRVLKTELVGREIIITVESTRDWARCSHCGRKTQEFHCEGRTLRLRHLPILGRRVYLEIKPKRFKCPYCDDHPTTTQQLDWYDARAPHTRAYEQALLLQLIGSTVTDVARKEGTTYAIVLGAVRRQLAPQVNWAEFGSLPELGIDEIALRKGHRDFVALVTTRKADAEIALLGVLPDRKKETVAAFLRTIPAPLRATIRAVCTDMYEGYVNAVKEEVPQASVVVDRFHVAQAYRDCADRLRREVQSELKAVLQPEEYAAFKGVMWVFRRSPQELSKAEREQLKLLWECAPDLKQAYDLREALTALFETEQSKEAAQLAFQQWMGKVRKSGLKCFDSFLGTLEDWLDEITNYFINRLTSGFVEGFNNKVKVLKRRCYGITNLTHLFQRLYLDLEGYRLYGT
jgi:transposase